MKNENKGISILFLTEIFPTVLETWQNKSKQEEF
jgi:hypothetical protein